MGDQKEAKRYKVCPIKMSEFERIHIINGFEEQVRNDGRE
jgi:hypothetical protein